MIPDLLLLLKIWEKECVSFLLFYFILQSILPISQNKPGRHKVPFVVRCDIYYCIGQSTELTKHSRIVLILATDVFVKSALVSACIGCDMRLIKRIKGTDLFVLPVLDWVGHPNNLIPAQPVSTTKTPHDCKIVNRII